MLKFTVGRQALPVSKNQKIAAFGSSYIGIVYTL